MEDADRRIEALSGEGYGCREISEILRAEGYGRGFGKSAIAERLRKRDAAPAPAVRAVRPAAPAPAQPAPVDAELAARDALLAQWLAIPAGYAAPIKLGFPLRKIVHEITPETADLLSRYGRAVFESPPGWTPPAPPWNPETEEAFTLPGVRHDIASNPRLAAGVMVAGSVVDAAATGAWFHEDSNGLDRPDLDLVLRALRHPYELARAVANVMEYGEESEDGPAAKGETVPIEEQLRAGLALLAAAADELRAMAQRAIDGAAAEGHAVAFLTSCDGWRRSVVEGWGVCEEAWDDDDAPAEDAAAPAAAEDAA